MTVSIRICILENSRTQEGHRVEDIVPDLSNIQGNIFGGFSKDHRIMLFLQFTDAAKARVWMKGMACNISSSEEVLAFNDLFKLIRKSKGIEGVVRATWTNIAFTSSGLKALGVPDFEINQFPDAFRQGMAARANRIGDVDRNAPTHWVGPFGAPERPVHAVLIVDSDIASDLDPSIAGTTLAQYKKSIDDTVGAVKIVYSQVGATRVDQPGHEQFGFKDGVSQPGIRGVDLPDDPLNDPNQGHPGQDLLHPGEFVLGYPTQIGTPDPLADGPNPLPGPISMNGPRWSKDGSFAVFRRLKQDVKGFRDNVDKLAHTLDWHKDLAGASLVGRYASGCPLERLKSQQGSFKPAQIDPGITDPGAAADDSVNNFFEYGDDADGKIVPRSAHIRKAYPRDQVGTLASGTDTESRTQTHRLLRRGIPYGNSLGAPSGGGPDEDRGLLFLCYQKDIEAQFEFVQTRWVNDPNFPCPEAAKNKDGTSTGDCPGDGQPDGEDPIMAQTTAGGFVIPGKPLRTSITHFVTTTGGDYFFAPSIEALTEVLSA
ncbi:MAG: hypothetical protein JWL77_5591 [Chthonomonadaceae bacterium]|nr:hypothetical protein [Chthonomonadaceae bacterium]